MADKVAVILAGGSGERFWPVSTPQVPKQLLHLTHPDKSLLQEAVERVGKLVGPENVYISTGPRIGAVISEANLVPGKNVLVEPEPRNTLGAICWVAASLRDLGHGDETSVAILTADHAIGEETVFLRTVDDALTVAKESGGMVTIGIQPTRPETGFGYIERGEERLGPAFRVASFREKPDAATAAHFISAGNFLWNGGMFFWSLGTFFRELAAHEPEAASLMQFLPGQPERFSELRKESIDRALMEKSERIYVVPAEFPWDDIGSWDSLDRTMDKDNEGNVVVGAPRIVDSHNNIVYIDQNLKVGLIGVEDLIVAATPNGVLICHKSQAQRVKEITSSF